MYIDHIGRWKTVKVVSCELMDRLASSMLRQKKKKKRPPILVQDSPTIHPIRPKCGVSSNTNQYATGPAPPLPTVLRGMYICVMFKV